MAQNLSYIQRELARVKTEAGLAAEKMRLLEKALSNVIRLGSIGGGTPTQAGVARVAGQVRAQPGMSPAGQFTGYKSVVSSEAAVKTRGIVTQMNAVKTELSSLDAQLRSLEAAAATQTAAVQQHTAAQTEAAVALSTLAPVQTAHDKATLAKTTQVTQSTKDALKSTTAQQTSTKIVDKLTEAQSKQTTAATKNASATEKATAKLGRLTTETPAQRVARISAARRETAKTAEQEKPVYTQQSLVDMYQDRPGTATKVQEVAGKAGFTSKDIKDITNYAGSFTQLKYAVRDADGVMQKMVLTTDKAGNVFTSTQKQFRTFFSSIRRNIGEMIKWSAATLVVWGSLRKLGELLEIAIKNETQLANVAIILGIEHANLAEIFDTVTDAAYATGESIDGVLEGYVAAYKATGNIQNQFERTRVAQVLLTDSLILSKLSTLSQTEALDTMVGALRQMGMGLDEGIKLIDKWIKVARYAQVSVETLAESFAITATSASNAGVSIDYLNGLIATIAEVTTLSASESGNAIRAFISSFKAESAVKELGQYGIAVKTLEGETRGFLDIMEEIAALFEAGIISEAQLNKIGRAIGGRGARREAQVVAVIQNLTRAQELAAIGADAEGEAQAALSIQLDVVQTALTRLSNSFQVLARTMGSDGGVLDATGQLLATFTQIVDSTSALTKHLGELTPVVAALGLALAITSAQSRQFYALQGTIAASGMLSKISPGLGRGFETAALASGLGRNAKFAGGAALQAGAGLLTAYTAYQSVQDEDYASAGGAIGGAAVGALLSGGSPIGIVIGMAAGKALGDAVFNYEPEFENFFKKTVGAGLEDADTSKVDVDPIQQAMAEAFTTTTAFGGESETGGRAVSALLARVKNYMAGFKELLGGGAAVYTTPEEEALAYADLAGKGEEVRRLLNEAKQYQQAQAGTEAAGFEFEFINKQQAFLAEYDEYLINLEATQAKAVRSRAIEGKITDRELRASLEIIPKLQASISKYAVGFGDAFQELNPQLKTATQTMDAFARVMVGSAPEQLDYLSSLNEEIARLTNLLELAKESGEDFIIFRSDDESTEASEEIRYNLEETNTALERAQQNAALFGSLLYQAAQAAYIELPAITTLDVKEEDLEKVFERAREKQREYIKSTFAEDLNEGISIEEIEATFDPIMVQAGESGGYIYAEGFMTSFLQGVVPAMQAAGEIIAPAPEALQLRQLDMTSAQFPAVFAEYQARVQDIRAQAAAGGWEAAITEETFAGLFTDYIAMPITADLTLLNLAMNELIDVNKKQLEGVYNLPTDASFFVPFQGYELGLGGEGGAGGDLSGAATELKEAARELKSLGEGEDWGQSLAEVMKEWFGAEEARRPTEFEGLAPRYELPEMFGPQQTRVLRDRWWEDQPAEQETFSDKFGRSVDSFNQGVDSQMAFWDKLFGITTKEPITTTPLVPQEDLVPQRFSTQPDVVEQPPRNLWERLLDLFINSDLFGSTGVGAGAGVGPGADFSRLDNAAQALENLAAAQQGQAAVGVLPPTGFADFGADFGSVIELLSQKISNLSGFTTNLKIASTTTTTLVVDGRVLAEIIKPYLYSDMIRFEDSATSVTKNIVV